MQETELFLDDPTPAPSRIPESLRCFDVEVVELDPLRVYIFTFSEEEWEQAKCAVSNLGDKLSRYSFIELSMKGSELRGVYANNLEKILKGSRVEAIQELAYQIQNGLDS